MFSVNPSGSNPKSPIMDPSSVAGDSRKGRALDLASSADEVPLQGALLGTGPGFGTGTKAWAPTQHIASTANDFMSCLCLLGVVVQLMHHQQRERVASRESRVCEQSVVRTKDLPFNSIVIGQNDPRGGPIQCGENGFLCLLTSHSKKKLETADTKRRHIQPM